MRNRLTDSGREGKTETAVLIDRERDRWWAREGQSDRTDREADG